MIIRWQQIRPGCQATRYKTLPGRWPWTRSRKQNCQWQDHPIQPLLAALVSACTQASEVQRPRVRDACSARERSRVTREHGGSDRHLRQTAKTASAVRVCIFTAAARLFEALEAV